MKHKIFVFIFLFVLILCIVIMAFLSSDNAKKTAEIYSNGKLVRKIDLSTVAEPFEVIIENRTDKNIVLVENGQISMKSSTCTGKECIKQGRLKNSAYPIVCLPNKVLIKLSNPETAGIDAISR